MNYKSWTFKIVDIYCDITVRSSSLTSWYPETRQESDREPDWHIPVRCGFHLFKPNITNIRAKFILVTGGNSGIGEGTARRFHQLGANVAILDVSDSPETISDTFLPIKCNVGSEEDATDTVKAILAKWGTINILVYNAGIMDKMVPATATDSETWSRVLNINLNGPFYLIRACLPIMLPNLGKYKGSIVNICSVAAVRGAAVGPAYTASKHGLLGLSRNTAWMHSKEGIQCNAILPGGVMTNITATSGVEFNPETNPYLAPFYACVPGVCQLAEIAETVLFLATAEGVNKAEIAVDRGWSTA